jgi:hypothetical protein
MIHQSDNNASDGHLGLLAEPSGEREPGYYTYPLWQVTQKTANLRQGRQRCQANGDERRVGGISQAMEVQRSAIF